MQYRNVRKLAKKLGVWIPDEAWHNSLYECLLAPDLLRRYCAGILLGPSIALRSIALGRGTPEPKFRTGLYGGDGPSVRKWMLFWLDLLYVSEL